MEVIVRITK
jgi:hypothetical protein